tara:strand:- start:410 stop:979 length:570 start_codon:yes stop_codon:yes gene_type:complete
MAIKEVIKTLRKLDVSSKTEKKQKLTYLSWTWAWDEVLINCPDATYQVIKQDNGLPYVYDPLTGYMVNTTVYIEGLLHEMWLPVMDGANKAMKAEPYTYQTRYNGEKTCEAASMFDINKTIMRCLVKNLAMFGLGLYIYAGEDLPEAINEISNERFDKAIEAIKSGKAKKEDLSKFDLTEDQEKQVNAL